MMRKTSSRPRRTPAQCNDSRLAPRASRLAPRASRLVVRLLLVTVVGLLLIQSISSLAAASQPFHAYLPMIVGSPMHGVLGLELAPGQPVSHLDAALPAAPSWVRLNGLRWSDVEPQPESTYNWDGPATRALEAQLIRAADLGLRVVLVLHGSPAWAVEPHKANCAPINPRHYAAFAAFAAAAVARYSAPPYNVQYWEIGNEPDAFIFEADAPYGCWGVTGDEYYGGRAFGELLKVTYPAVKAVNPQIQVIHGGLLLSAPYEPATDKGREARFIEGVLEAGAGNAFDLLGYHTYGFFNGSPDGTVGIQDWKPGYLRDILARYGLQKPLINTESALLCRETTDTCALAQAHAIPRLYARALRDDIVGYVWYIFDSDSFYSTALAEPGNLTAHRPAYQAFAYASQSLTGFSYAGALSGLPPDAEGHRLTSGSRTTLVVWSDRPQPALLTVQSATGLRCAEWDGTPLPCIATDGTLRLTLGPGPRYISWAAP